MGFDQKKYINSYNKDTYKTFLLRIRKDNKSIMEKLTNESNVNKYIMDLIDNDINPGVLTIKQIKEAILPILFKHQIHEVYLFGSYSRGEANKSSDVDIYCEHGDIKNLYDSVSLDEELKNALNKDVDVVFFGSTMNEYFKKQLEIDKIKLC